MGAMKELFTGFNKVVCTEGEGSHSECVACGGTGRVIGHMDDVYNGLVSEDEILEMEVYCKCELCSKEYRDFIPSDPSREQPILICGECHDRLL
jgi:hypothetical protein